MKSKKQLKGEIKLAVEKLSSDGGFIARIYSDFFQADALGATRDKAIKNLVRLLFSLLLAEKSRLLTYIKTNNERE